MVTLIPTPTRYANHFPEDQHTLDKSFKMFYILVPQIDQQSLIRANLLLNNQIKLICT